MYKYIQQRETFVQYTQKRTMRTLGIALCAIMAVLMLGLAIKKPASAAELTTDRTIDIKYDSPTGIHFVEDPQYPNEPIVLYCMNNKRAWPHEIEGVTPPAYYDGYLTPDMFKSQADYDECILRLNRILYAGYPHNGRHLYRLVKEGEEALLTKDEYNRMLKAPKELIEAFPYLVHHDFTLDDYYENDVEHLDILKRFVREVGNLSQSGQTTSNGLRYKDIAVMPFCRAAYCIVLATNSDALTPEQAFNDIYMESHFVTHRNAYDATQDAIWATLNHFGIEDNDFDKADLSGLALTFYEEGKRGSLLQEEPDSSKVHLAGDLTFTYNAKDGMWHSGIVRIEEPEDYHGVYKLVMPEGMTALCDNLTYVYAGEEYELLSDHEPIPGETLQIEAEVSWLKEMKQYRPSRDVTVDGRPFQNMVGEVVRNKRVGDTFALAGAGEGSLTVSKKVAGPAPSDAVYEFEVRLTSTPLNGLYGDMEFHDGVARVALHAGESARAHHIPAGATYEVTELTKGDFATTSTGAKGSIVADGSAEAVFVNSYAVESVGPEPVPERPDRPERPEHPDQHEQQDRPERPEVPQDSERPEEQEQEGQQGGASASELSNRPEHPEDSHAQSHDLEAGGSVSSGPEGFEQGKNGLEQKRDGSDSAAALPKTGDGSGQAAVCVTSALVVMVGATAIRRRG